MTTWLEHIVFTHTFVTYDALVNDRTCLVFYTINIDISICSIIHREYKIIMVCSILLFKSTIKKNERPNYVYYEYIIIQPT
jgi:hypothetical protein